MKEVLALFAKRLKASGMDELIHASDCVVVGFSGGADSSLLLFLLHEYLKGSAVHLAAAHLNHMIRGEEADRDEAFCRKVAEKYGIECYTKRVDVPRLARDGGSVEEVARRERYAFFDEIRKAQGGRVLAATAHNADDHLETVLFNLVRGSAAVGMCGIPPIRDGIYIRPLLPYLGREIRRMCHEMSIEYVVDSTNLHTEYTRNKIRATVVPALCDITEEPQIAALRMSAALRVDNECLDRISDEFHSELNGNRAKVDALISLHDAVLSRVLIRMYRDAVSLKDARLSLERVHIDEIISHLRGECTKFEISVPGRISFFRDGESAGFRDTSKAAVVDKIPEKLEIDVPVTKNGYVILLKRQSDIKLLPHNENIYNLSIHKAISFDKINGKFKVRTRAEGDVFRYGGMTRRVKKLFSEGKFPQDVRDRIPIIEDGEGIVWIPGFPVRDGLRPKDGEEIAEIFCFKLSDFEKCCKLSDYELKIKTKLK